MKLSIETVIPMDSPKPGITWFLFFFNTSVFIILSPFYSCYFL